jgi:L-serine deaminase
MALVDEIKEKERRVREYLKSKGLKGLLLKRQANFSWMTGGALNLVGIITEMGATSLHRGFKIRDLKQYRKSSHER